MEFTNEIVKHIGIYSINKKSGWRGELNLVAWNGREPKLEIREWSPDHDKCSKGVTFTSGEAERLFKLMKTIYEEVEVNARTNSGEKDVFNDSENSDANRATSGVEC